MLEKMASHTRIFFFQIRVLHIFFQELSMDLASTFRRMQTIAIIMRNLMQTANDLYLYLVFSLVRQPKAMNQ